MGFMPKRIDVVVLFVADLDRAKTFYRDVLGLEVANEDADSAYFPLETASLLLLTASAAQNLLGSEAASEPPSAGAWSQLVATVDDVDALYADLVSRGVEVIREPADQWWGLRTAHFKDPDGHLWEINQPMAAGGRSE
jgi:catechol 2,3-dioxygenase-like lactoylglutathione lyase family enzyme